MARLMGAMAAALVLAGPGLAQDTQPEASLSRAEVDASPPETIARRLFGEGGSNLRPMWEANLGGRSADAPLRLLAFRALGRSSGFSGLCVAEQVQVRFASAGTAANASTQVHPDRTWSTPVYFLRDDRIDSPLATVSDAARPAEDAACRAIDPRHVHVYLSPEPERLARALAVLSQAIARARRGAVIAPIDCSATGWEGHAPLDAARCTALISRIELDRADSVRPCPGAEPWRCTLVEIGFDADAGPIDRIELRIEDGEPGQPPARLAVSRVAPPTP